MKSDLADASPVPQSKNTFTICDLLSGALGIVQWQSFKFKLKNSEIVPLQKHHTDTSKNVGAELPAVNLGSETMHTKEIPMDIVPPTANLRAITNADRAASGTSTDMDNAYNMVYEGHQSYHPYYATNEPPDKDKSLTIL
ncbi:hypothetical protein PV326_009125 [Microctonus aethiopoides]|nr:hypothetical protein PV326_009125 [Microctonus aethiopoides]